MQWNALVPELVVGNYPNARDFYLKVFGFRLCYERAWDQFGYFELEGAQLMLLQASGAPVGELQRPGPKGKGIHFQVEVQRLADLLARLQAANVEPLTPVTDAWYRADELEHGQREFFVADPDGYLFRFFEYLGDRPATGNGGA